MGSLHVEVTKDFLNHIFSSTTADKDSIEFDLSIIAAAKLNIFPSPSFIQMLMYLCVPSVKISLLNFDNCDHQVTKSNKISRLRSAARIKVLVTYRNLVSSNTLTHSLRMAIR